MSGVRTTVACMTLLALVTALSSLWLEAEALSGATDSNRSILQQLLWSGVLFALRYTPLVVTAYLIGQAVLVFLWTIRPPRIVAGGSADAIRDLSAWLAWSLAIAVITFGAITAASVAHVRGRGLFMLLIPPFGVAYSAALYRALQLQTELHQSGRSRVTAPAVALAAFLPILALPLWPMGLVVPAWVVRRAKADAAQQPGAPDKVRR